MPRPATTRRIVRAGLRRDARHACGFGSFGFGRRDITITAINGSERRAEDGRRLDADHRGHGRDDDHQGRGHDHGRRPGCRRPDRLAQDRATDGTYTVTAIKVVLPTRRRPGQRDQRQHHHRHPAGWHDRDDPRRRQHEVPGGRRGRRAVRHQGRLVHRRRGHAARRRVARCRRRSAAGDRGSRARASRAAGTAGRPGSRTPARRHRAAAS